jgi:hypothetical protein
MSLGRREEEEVEKDGAELSREEPEDIDGESGGVGCRSLVWSNGHAMDHLKGQGRRVHRRVRGFEDAGRIKKRMKARVGCASAAEYDCVGSCG